MPTPEDRKLRLAVYAIIGVTVILVAVLWLSLLGIRNARGADMVIPKRDPRCNTAARYDAMREAYEKRKPDPCNGAIRWVP